MIAKGYNEVSFFMHGFGSSAEEFRHLWDLNIVEGISVFLDGPEADKFTSKKRWFPFTSEPKAIRNGLDTAISYADKEIRKRLASLGYSADSRISLVGHSQGAMIALGLLNKRSFNISSVHSFCGYLPESLFDPTGSAELVTALHIYFSTIDQYVNTAEYFRTIHYFKRIPWIKTTCYTTPHLSHGFSSEWLRKSNFDLAAE